MTKTLIKQLERALDLVREASIDDLFDLAWHHCDADNMGYVYYDPSTDTLQGAGRKNGESADNHDITAIALLSISLHEDAPSQDRETYYNYLTGDNYWKDEAVDALEDFIADLKEELDA